MTELVRFYSDPRASPLALVNLAALLVPFVTPRMLVHSATNRISTITKNCMKSIHYLLRLTAPPSPATFWFHSATSRFLIPACQQGEVC